MTGAGMCNSEASWTRAEQNTHDGSLHGQQTRATPASVAPHPPSSRHRPTDEWGEWKPHGQNMKHIYCHF